MPDQKLFSHRQLSLLCLTFLILFVPVLAQKPQSESPSSERKKLFLSPSTGLEISRLQRVLPLYKDRNSLLLIRDMLPINNEVAAKDFTALAIEAQVENDTIKVRLSLIYNDVKKADWWKDKKEKQIAEFAIASGESSRPVELMEFGIEPFEIKAISAEPVILKPNEYPRIFSPSNSLEVVEVEKSITGYRFSLKTIPPKILLRLS